MDFKILRTNRFNDNLQDIITYIKDEFSLNEAIEYLDYFEEQMTNLLKFPYIGSVPRSTTISKQGYRVLVSKQNLIFYKVDEQNKVIILYTIVSAKQDYLNMI